MLPSEHVAGPRRSTVHAVVDAASWGFPWLRHGFRGCAGVEAVVADRLPMSHILDRLPWRSALLVVETLPPSSGAGLRSQVESHLARIRALQPHAAVVFVTDHRRPVGSAALGRSVHLVNSHGEGFAAILDALASTPALPASPGGASTRPQKGRPAARVPSPVDPSSGTQEEDRTARLVDGARAAAKEFWAYDQLMVDHIVASMSKAGVENERLLAQLAVAETGMGNVEDKVTKNHFAAQVVFEHLSDQASVGVIDDAGGILTVAEPFGVIAAVTPVTNPTSTVIFKSLIALKGRNVVIFAFHPRAQRCGEAAARIMRDAAVSAGAPEHCIQWISAPSVGATESLMRNEGVSLVLATGGSAMVKAAYSSGNPALGVGPGNVPVYVEKSADLTLAVAEIIASKTFDNGTICSSDQCVIFDDQGTAKEALRLLAAQGAYVADGVEKVKLEAVMFDKERGVPAPEIVGRTARLIAERAGVDVPAGTRLLLVPLDRTGEADWMSHEKLSPVLGWFVASSRAAAMEAAVAQLEFGGAGHTAVIFTRDDEVLREFSLRVPANRVLVNQPAVYGAIGSLYNDLTPSLTLGCGARGGNSSTDNIGFRNLLNLKRVVRRRADDDDPAPPSEGPSADERWSAQHLA